MAGSILPGWARAGSSLPPWYGPGGARGPSTTPAQPMTTSVAMPPPSRNIRTQAMGGGAGTGRTTAVNTGPSNNQMPNPWLETGQDTALVDSILGQLRNNQGVASQNIQSRLNNVGTSPIERVTAEQRSYNPSAEFKGALGEAKDWTETGGFSDSDLSAIRARGISPIRAVYANANRNMERQRALQGGYAPGMNTAISRMAREMSDQVSTASRNVEADIAERVQSGKQFGLGRYSDLASRENDIMQSIMEANAAAKERASQFNAGSANEANLMRERMRDSIFGEATANNDRFFDNALQLANLRHNIVESGRRGNLSFEDLNQRGGIALMDAMMRQYGGR